jgi:hypothetical protein
MSNEVAVILILGAIALALLGWWFLSRHVPRRSPALSAMAEDRFGLHRRPAETDGQLRERCLRSLSLEVPTLSDIEEIATELPNVRGARAKRAAPGVVELEITTKRRHRLTPKQDSWLTGRFSDVVPIGVAVVIKEVGSE